MVALPGCAGLGVSAPAATQTIEIDGLSYRVEQLTASTWTATPLQAQMEGPQKTAGLVRAIEKVSACKVTNSSPGQQGKALNAQVDCGSRLKN